MNILGVKLTSHDTGAALISGGRIVAVAEERLNRVKHSNAFPEYSIQYCLDGLGLEPEDIDLVVMDQVDLPSKLRMREIFRGRAGGKFSRAEFYVINHHDAHAASAFFCSPFEEAAVLVCDGAGEKFVTHLGVTATETETLYCGSGQRLFPIQKTMHFRDGKVFPYTFGAGKLYELLSSKYLGFGPYNEGKMMGLAPYGNASLFSAFPEECWYGEKNGHWLCNADISFPGQAASGLVNFLRYRLPQFWRRSAARFAFSLFFSKSELFAEPDFFSAIRLKRPARKDDALPDEYYASVAYASQCVLEKVAVELGKKLKAVTNSKNICVAGGVGLNIDANRKLLDQAGFEHLFAQPGASDTGIALGCALWGWHVTAGKPRFWVMRSASLGRPYRQEEVAAAIDKYRDRLTVRKPLDVAGESAELISRGKIVGWFQGGSEYGPRALGNRSILCDPRPAAMRDILNRRVKHREPWRPFAASVLLEEMPKWFELESESPFMLLAAKVRKDKVALVPAVVHVDGTTRIQTVTKEANGRYYDLIASFHRLTGMPLILNTSFNDSGEPIVETPEEAISDFMKLDMDCLVLEDYIITRA